MNKKGSMELSVNSIVILVIAIVMLGLILGFVKSKFSDLDNSLLAEEPAPATATSSDPITVSRPAIVASNGKNVAMKISMYNGESTTFTGSPYFTCAPSATGSVAMLTQSFNSKDIAMGKAVEFEGILGLSGDRGKYLCSICFGPASVGTAATSCSTGTNVDTKDFTIEIK
jgi:hypothetical protein